MLGFSGNPTGLGYVLTEIDPSLDLVSSILTYGCNTSKY